MMTFNIQLKLIITCLPIDISAK